MLADPERDAEDFVIQNEQRGTDLILRRRTDSSVDGERRPEIADFLITEVARIAIRPTCDTGMARSSPILHVITHDTTA